MSALNEISERELKILTLFRAKSLKLQKSTIAHMPKKTTIKWKVDEEIQVEGLTEEIVEKGLVVSVREFMNGETTGFNKVVNLVSTYYNTDNEKVARLRDYKKEWSKIFGPNRLFGIGPSGKPLTNKEIFDMVAYSSHIHTNIDNKERYEKYTSLMDGWLAPIVHVQLEAMILAIAKITNMLRVEFIEDILKRKK